MVSMPAFFIDYPSSNPADNSSFIYLVVLREEAGV